MKALLIYDSMFGNTEKVAQAMATALGEQAAVTARRVADVTSADLATVDLLIVGSPTQGFQPTSATKQLLDRLSARSLQGVKVAAFDTRMTVEDVNVWVFTMMVKLFGYAAKPIANRLQQKGGDLVMPPEGFLVTGKEGPLKEGELARAAAWAQQVAQRVTPASEPVAVL